MPQVTERCASNSCTLANSHLPPGDSVKAILSPLNGHIQTVYVLTADTKSNGLCKWLNVQCPGPAVGDYNAVDMYITHQGLMDQSCPAHDNTNQQVWRNKVMRLTDEFLCVSDLNLKCLALFLFFSFFQYMSTGNIVDTH